MKAQGGSQAANRQLLRLLVAVVFLLGGSFAALAQAPVITSLSPGSTLAGGPALTLTVNGSGFGDVATGATVQWNGTPRATTFVSSTQLTASVLAADLQTSTVNVVWVTTPSGASNVVYFQVYPVISSLNPPSVLAGSPSFTLVLIGAGFGDSDVVQWNGSPLVTTWINTTQSTAVVPTALVATAGTAAVIVLNQPDQLVSAPATFTVNNPVPAISGLSPGSVAAGSADLTLTVNGSGFVAGSVVRWNGSDRATTFISPNQLQAVIPATDVGRSGTASVTVVNSPPGGGASAPASVTISVPRFSVTPSTLDFGEVLVGSSLSRILTISNLENTSLQVFASTTAGSPFTASPATITLPPSGSATLAISFDPPAARRYGAVASLLTSAGGETLVSLDGLGVASLLTYRYSLPAQSPVTLTPGDSVLFPATDIGETASALFEVQARGTSAIINTIASNSAVFTLSNLPSLPATLSANGSLTFMIGFRPTVAGTVSGLLSVNNQPFLLTGTGVLAPLTYRYAVSGQPPVGVSSGATIPLPSVGTGSTSSALFEIENPGTIPASINSISSSSTLFALTGLPSFPTTVPAGGNMTFTIQFQPVLPGRATASLVVGSQSFVLSGIGLVSGITLSGVQDMTPPAEQPRAAVSLSSPYAMPLTGQLLLTFTPTSDNPSDDPAVQFSSGGRAVDFTIPANDTRAQFGEAFDIGFSTGTVAGNIQISVALRNGLDTVTPNPDPSRTAVVERRAPTIANVSVSSRTASGFEIVVTGYATTRSLTRAGFQFAARPGSNVQGGAVNLNVESLFTTWYQEEESRAFGSQFRLRVPFTVQGDANAIGSVSVTLSNIIGTSTPYSVNF
ncbi:MAG: choice-of-anchor D domain-containing protein [Acidobacteriota bacterium]